ncbi:uncharacterized protein LOC115227290 [Octopus sinensis]|uniref:Uncharacterized protein LOC115227290 n=1 Tax=Octopus sinensis TaxID=2607531 RepID=A0A6P7TPD0_9MOLL|nr:uncharacterized protein LOC115227290 [Octopus sinensis]
MHRARHKTTWTGFINIYNQIDYIICRSKDKALFTDARSYGGSNIDSDHKMVIARISLNKHLNNTNIKGRQDILRKRILDLNGLSIQQMGDNYRKYLDTYLGSVETNQPFPKLWGQIQESIRGAAEKQLMDREMVTTSPNGTTEISLLAKKQKSIWLQYLNTENKHIKEKLGRERLNIKKKIKKCVFYMSRKEAEIQIKAMEALKDNGRSNSKGIDGYTGHPRKLELEITPAEVQRACADLKNNKSPGPDGLGPELLKYGSEKLNVLIADLFNGMFKTNNHLPLGRGILVPVQKPNKAKGKVENLRPVILMNSIRKVLAIITLERIKPRTELFISAFHSGFREGRSTSDIVWIHRWHCSAIQSSKMRHIFLTLICQELLSRLTVEISSY